MIEGEVHGNMKTPCMLDAVADVNLANRSMACLRTGNRLATGSSLDASPTFQSYRSLSANRRRSSQTETLRRLSPPLGNPPSPKDEEGFCVPSRGNDGQLEGYTERRLALPVASLRCCLVLRRFQVQNFENSTTLLLYSAPFYALPRLSISEERKAKALKGSFCRQFPSSPETRCTDQPLPPGNL